MYIIIFITPMPSTGRSANYTISIVFVFAYNKLTFYVQYHISPNIRKYLY